MSLTEPSDQDVERRPNDYRIPAICPFFGTHDNMTSCPRLAFPHYNLENAAHISVSPYIWHFDISTSRHPHIPTS